MQVGGKRGQAGGAGARFQPCGVDVDPSAPGSLPGPVFDRLPAEAEPVGPRLMHRENAHFASRGDRGRCSRGSSMTRGHATRPAECS